MAYFSTDNARDLNHWKAMKGGSVAAFEQLYDHYFPLLFAYGMQFCTDRALVKDCLQDFFVDLYQGRSSLNEVHKVRQYLFVSFRHYILRKLSAKHFLMESIADNYHFEVYFSREEEIVGEQFDEYRRKVLKSSFARLSSRQKEAVFLRFYENMSYTEIAEILNLKEVKYARTLVYRALLVLKEALKGHSLTLYSAFPFFNLLIKQGSR
jgi:RNA polymerase sigma factor (sigma-70 family)